MDITLVRVAVVVKGFGPSPRAHGRARARERALPARILCRRSAKMAPGLKMRVNVSAFTGSTHIGKFLLITDEGAFVQELAAKAWELLGGQLWAVL